MISVTLQPVSAAEGPSLCGVSVKVTVWPGVNGPAVSSFLSSFRLNLIRPPSSVGLSATLAPPAFEPVAGVLNGTVPSAGLTSESLVSVVVLLSVTPDAFCVVHE